MEKLIFNLEKGDKVWFFTKEGFAEVQEMTVHSVVETRLKKHIIINGIEGSISTYKKRNRLKLESIDWVDERNDCICFMATSKEKLIENVNEYYETKVI